MTKALSLEEFIVKSNLRHNHKYDYSKTKYSNNRTLIIVTCPIHGDFEQLPSAHLKYSGCSFCKHNNKNYKLLNKFIKKANIVHNMEYDYNKVVYKDHKSKVIITCQKHGDFLQSPGNHLNGSRCTKCSKVGCPKNTEHFIIKAREKHGFKFDYSKVKYIDVHSKVIIICPKHGEFKQSPQKHYYHNGCKKCRVYIGHNNGYLTNEEFIVRARRVHGNKYNYDCSQYKDTNSKLSINCPAHGQFQQTPHSHLNGVGCLSCGGSLRKTIDEFIKKANIIHNNRYDYSKAIYKNLESKIVIICPIHGDFNQIAGNHLKSGCFKCYGTEKLTTEIFTQRAKNVHGDKYDYNKVDYQGLRKKVTITCKKHGDFIQSACNHLEGVGCPVCKESKGENKVAMTLNQLNAVYHRQVKFDTCKYKRLLLFDFVVKPFFGNKIKIIEYQGQQHYKPVNIYGNRTNGRGSNFEVTQIRDNIKREWCKNNKVDLLEIPYTEFDNIESIVTKFLMDESI